jgi:hypothetical protein
MFQLFGRPGGTSDETHATFVDYVQPSQETHSGSDNIRADAANSFQSRLAAASAKMSNHVHKPSVEVCREYLSVLKREADACGNTVSQQILVTITSKANN